jgi:hypothetical protein
MEIRMDFYWLFHRHVTVWVRMKRGRESKVKNDVQIYGALFTLSLTPLSHLIVSAITLPHPLRSH